MKTFFAKATGLVLVLGMMLNTGLFAQTTPNTNSTPSSGTSKTEVTTTNQTAAKPSMTHRQETKDQWLKHYNDMKPKLDALSSKAKAETKNPELTTEVTKLNRMAGDFKGKIDSWDKISADKRDAYNSDLRASQKALNEQYEKTKHMYDKIHPAPKPEPAMDTPKN